MIRPVIMKSLDCSMKHITAKDKELLGMTPAWITVYNFTCGFIVLITDDLADQQENLTHLGYSRAFWEVLMLAHGNNCDYLQLDNEGTVYADLPKF